MKVEENRIISYCEDNKEYFSEYALREIAKIVEEELQKREEFYGKMVKSINEMLERGEGDYVYKNIPYYEDKSSELYPSNRVCPDTFDQILKLFRENDTVEYKGELWILRHEITLKEHNGQIQKIYFKVTKVSSQPLKIN